MTKIKYKLQSVEKKVTIKTQFGTLLKKIHLFIFKTYPCIYMYIYVPYIILPAVFDFDRIGFHNFFDPMNIV